MWTCSFPFSLISLLYLTIVFLKELASLREFTQHFGFITKAHDMESPSWFAVMPTAPKALKYSWPRYKGTQKKFESWKYWTHVQALRNKKKKIIGLLLSKMCWEEPISHLSSEQHIHSLHLLFSLLKSTLLFYRIWAVFHLSGSLGSSTSVINVGSHADFIPFLVVNTTDFFSSPQGYPCTCKYSSARILASILSGQLAWTSLVLTTEGS